MLASYNEPPVPQSRSSSSTPVLAENVKPRVPAPAPAPAPASAPAPAPAPAPAQAPNHSARGPAHRPHDVPLPASSNHQPQPKILFVGDSIIGHANIKVIADATHSEIVTSKAYSAIHDEVSNKAKAAAYFPRKNFLNVVPIEVAKDNFEHIVVQAGSVDIRT